MSGGTFTISNGGVFGSLYGTPMYAFLSCFAWIALTLVVSTYHKLPSSVCTPSRTSQLSLTAKSLSDPSWCMSNSTRLPKLSKGINADSTPVLPSHMTTDCSTDEKLSLCSFESRSTWKTPDECSSQALSRVAGDQYSHNQTTFYTHAYALGGYSGTCQVSNMVGSHAFEEQSLMALGYRTIYFVDLIGKN